VGIQSAALCLVALYQSLQVTLGVVFSLRLLSYLPWSSFTKVVLHISGAQSLISNAMVGGIVLIVISFLSSIFYYVPLAVLGAAIISAVAGSFKISQFTEIWKLGLKADFFTMVITALCTVFIGPIQGIGIGMSTRHFVFATSVVHVSSYCCDAGYRPGAGLSILFVLYRSAFPKVRILGRLPESNAFREVKNFPEAETFPGIQVIRFDADLYFANSGKVFQLSV
jgi:MFS superfamily sulfate permease-like transporter